MFYLRYLCLFAYIGVQHILCRVFVLFVFVLCTLCCQFLSGLSIFYFIFSKVCLQVWYLYEIVVIIIQCTIVARSTKHISFNIGKGIDNKH